MFKKRLLFASLIIFALVLAAGGPVQAGGRTPFSRLGGQVSNTGGPVSGRFPISMISNAPTHNSESNPAVAYNSGFMKTYLVVWDQLDATSENSIVYGQFVGPDGGLNGDRFAISLALGYNQHPAVAYNPSLDRFLVVYEVGDLGIYGQVLNNAGGRVGSEYNIVDATGGVPRQPAVVYASVSDKYLFAWRRDQGASRGIEARSFNGDFTGPYPVPIEITGMLASVGPSEPDIAYDSAVDQALVVWQKWASAGSTQHDIQGRRIHPAGGLHVEGSTVDIHYTDDDEVNPAVAALPVPASTGGKYLVICQRWYGSLSYIDGWLVNADTGTRNTWIAISPATGYVPAVAANATSQEYLAAWTRDNTTLEARTFSSVGAAPAGSSLLSGVFVSRPAIASGRLGDSLVAFQDMSSAGYPPDVFGWLWGTRVNLPLIRK